MFSIRCRLIRPRSARSATRCIRAVFSFTGNGGNVPRLPEPAAGVFFGKNGQPAPREVLRNAPFGRIAFADSDLAGIMNHRASILEADRAVKQIVEASKPEQNTGTDVPWKQGKNLRNLPIRRLARFRE
jgi:hypothetical protein